MLLFSGCGVFDLDSDDNSSGVVAKKLDLPHGDLTITQLDEKFLLSASLIGFNDDVLGAPAGIVWESSDVSKLTVDAKGEITTHAAGKVSVSATYGELTKSVDIVINETGEFIQGQIFYEDRKYSVGGFNRTQFNEVRFSTVDMLDVKGNVLESGSTDSQGKFQFGHVIPGEYSIRVLSQIDDEPAPGFNVKDMSRDLYAVTQKSIVDQTEYKIEISMADAEAGAFNILDVIVSAAEFSKEKLLVDVADLSVYWEPNNIYGTYYCSGFDAQYCRNNEGIYALSMDDDTDEYDDDVLLHEFGHFVMDKYFVDNSPAGCHFITDNDLDLRLSWSEGWGTFFAAAVKLDIKQKTPNKLSAVSSVTSYVDTDGHQYANISYDITKPSFEGASSDSFNYASSEFAVSNILWSVYKNRLFSMDRITDVLTKQFSSSSKPTNLPNFWQGLLQSDLFANSDLPSYLDAFAQRKVYYQEDVDENDDSIETANLIQVGAGSAPSHYLYKDNLANDVDMFAFNVLSGRSYRVETSQLRNGIDTYIRILDKNGNIVSIDSRNLENDDKDKTAHYRYDNDPACEDYRFFNSKNALASSIEFKAGVSERLFVEVSHISSVPSKFMSVGSYGSYKLAVALVN